MAAIAKSGNPGLRPLLRALSVTTIDYLFDEFALCHDGIGVENYRWLTHCDTSAQDI
jgi:hypothetical protein